MIKVTKDGTLQPGLVGRLQCSQGGLGWRNDLSDLFNFKAKLGNNYSNIELGKKMGS